MQQNCIDTYLCDSEKGKRQVKIRSNRNDCIRTVRNTLCRRPDNYYQPAATWTGVFIQSLV